MPNMVIRAQTHQKLEILIFFSIISSVLTMPFKWALNHYRAVIFSQVMNIYMPKYDERHVWAQNAKYGHSGPDPPKIKNFELFRYYHKRLTNTLQMSPQPLLGDNFKPTYDFFYVKIWRKTCFGPKMPNMVIWAQTPRKKFFFDFFVTIITVLPIRLKWALNHYQVIILSQVMNFFPIFPISGTLWVSQSVSKSVSKSVTLFSQNWVMSFFWFFAWS